MLINLTGRPINRLDARLKVTGAAKYAAEFNAANLAYAFPVRSTIANGTITSFEVGAAEASPGVITVLTHLNTPRLRAFDPQALEEVGGRLGEAIVPLQDSKVNYFGQYVACVVTETYEQARHAAALVNITYAEEKPTIDLESELPNGFRPEQNALGQQAQLNAGQAAPLLATAPIKMEQTYTTSTENHHPMEPHSTIAIWEGADKLSLYDSTQGVMLVRSVLAYFLGLEPENVRVRSPYLGGGFGCKAAPWMNLLTTAIAGRTAQRPVKLVITRQMMQTSTGRRGATHQTVALGASQDGKLTVIRHQIGTYTGVSQFFEPSGAQTQVLYAAPQREITYQVAQLNIGAPTFMRAPGEASGAFALESAMDELAYELNMDPVEFRVLNHTATDRLQNIPFSSENLLECYRIGAEKFGWSRRRMQPRQIRDGRYLVGMGMATATYPGTRSANSARIQMTADGAVKVMSATQDLGTGTYTIMAQTAADALGVPVERITVEIGDSALPPGSLSVGSQTTASINPAVLAAGEMLRSDLLQLATTDTNSRLYGRNSAEIGFANAGFFLESDRSQADSYADIIRRNAKSRMEACATAMPASGSDLGAPGAPCQPAPTAAEANSDPQKYSFHSFGAQFVEVHVDEDLGTIRVKRFVSVQDVGRIMNEKTARSQIIGGVIYALGQTLMEETEYDHRWANPVTRTLADYHVPVQLDVPEIEVQFIGKPDPHISPIGARGAGEIGGVGVSAAVANAVFNATGKRLRDLPLTLDKLL